MDRSTEEILNRAIIMAQEAGDILREMFRSDELSLDTKSNIFDVVTSADKASEEAIISRIKAWYPHHDIVSEESCSLLTDADYCWIIDPLDGTTNYSQGLPIYSVSIAVEYKGEMLIGVVYIPFLNEMFWGVKDNGAFLNGRPLKCSDKTDLESSVVATGFPYDKLKNPDNNLNEIGRITPRVRGLRRMGSAAVDLCYVAAGFFDAYWELNLNIWDIAAGLLIAKEAGTLDCPIRKDRRYSILVSAPGIYESIVKILESH